MSSQQMTAPFLLRTQILPSQNTTTEPPPPTYLTLNGTLTRSKTAATAFIISAYHLKLHGYNRKMHVFENSVKDEDYAALTSLNSIPGKPVSEKLATSFSRVRGEDGIEILRLENSKFGNSKGQCVFVADKNAGEGGRILVVSKSVHLDWDELKSVALVIDEIEK